MGSRAAPSQEFSDFWVLSARSTTTYAWVSADDLRPLNPRHGIWDHLDDVARGDLSHVHGLPDFTVDRRGRVSDFLWTLGNPYKLVSTRVLDVLDQIGATGWHSRPVTIRYKNGDPLPDFHLLAVTGACDSIDLNYDPATRYNAYDDVWRASGIDFTEGWDGSDLFWSRGLVSNATFATGRVHAAFTDAGLTGWEATPGADYEVRVDPPQTLDDPA
ncbi:hypothetical protein GCM10027425_23430 [Alteromonas gracilis]